MLNDSKSLDKNQRKPGEQNAIEEIEILRRRLAQDGIYIDSKITNKAFADPKSSTLYLSDPDAKRERINIYKEVMMEMLYSKKRIRRDLKEMMRNSKVSPKKTKIKNGFEIM